jgi:bacterioferritin
LPLFAACVILRCQVSGRKWQDSFPAWDLELGTLTVRGGKMKGNPNVLAVLQEALKAELTAINQYFVHAEMCENWGYKRLAGLIKKESIEEMKRAEKLIGRILFLDGAPIVSDYFKINIGDTVPKQFQNDLEVEYAAVARLNGGVKLCADNDDAGSRELLEDILAEEEEHVDWLETQLQTIREIGLDNYLAEQVKE